MIEVHPETTCCGDVPSVWRCIASTLRHWTAQWKKRRNLLAIETGEARPLSFSSTSMTTFSLLPPNQPSPRCGRAQTKHEGNPLSRQSKALEIYNRERRRHVLVQFRFDVRRNQWLPILCAEDKMDQDGRQRLRHTVLFLFYSALSGLAGFVHSPVQGRLRLQRIAPGYCIPLLRSRSKGAPLINDDWTIGSLSR